MLLYSNVKIKTSQEYNISRQSQTLCFLTGPIHGILPDHYGGKGNAETDGINPVEIYSLKNDKIIFLVHI